MLAFIIDEQDGTSLAQTNYYLFFPLSTLLCNIFQGLHSSKGIMLFQILQHVFVILFSDCQGFSDENGDCICLITQVKDTNGNCVCLPGYNYVETGYKAFCEPTVGK